MFILLDSLYRFHSDLDYYNSTSYSVSHMLAVTRCFVPRMHLATSKRPDKRDSCFLRTLPGLWEQREEVCMGGWESRRVGKIIREGFSKQDIPLPQVRGQR